jgi:hypothetical protein
MGQLVPLRRWRRERAGYDAARRRRRAQHGGAARVESSC